MGAELTKLLQEKFGAQVLGTHAYRGQQTVLIRREGLMDVARFL